MIAGTHHARRYTTLRRALAARFVALASLVALAGLVGLVGLAAAPTGFADDPKPAGATRPGELKRLPRGEVWITTDYSTVIVREEGRVRVLYFVRDSGEQVIESAMDMAVPHKLLIGYTRAMFASYLFTPEPRKVLIVGHGAGSMVRFLERYDPSVEIVSIDIDPKILEIAEDYFGTRPSEKVRILAVDGFAFIRENREKFDVVYMDAFLKPSSDTDSTGVPLDMKTAEFYGQIKDRLAPGGVVVFNINFHSGAREDIERIRKNFPGMTVFQVPGTGNVVVVATLDAEPVSPERLREVGEKVDARLKADFPIGGFANTIATLAPAE